MFRTGQKVYDISESQNIWLRPGEDLRALVPFGQDMSGATYTLVYIETIWPFLPAGIDLIEEGELTDVFDTDDEVDGDIYIDLTSVFLEDWYNRTMELQLIVNDGASVWVAADINLTISASD